MEDGFTINIKHVNNNRVVKINIIFEVKLESSGRLTVLLAVFTVFSQVIKCFLINVMPGSF